MLDNKRFIKFKFEKNKNYLKIENNKIHILFYSEKNTLLSSGLDDQKDLLKFLKKNIDNESSSSFIVRSEKGMFLLVKRKTQNKDLTNRYLEDLGGTIFNKIKSVIPFYAI